MLQPDSNQVTLRGRNLDGVTFVLRETMRVLAPDGLETSSAYLVGGQFQTPNRTVWRKVASFDVP